MLQLNLEVTDKINRTSSVKNGTVMGENLQQTGIWLINTQIKVITKREREERGTIFSSFSLHIKALWKNLFSIIPFEVCLYIILCWKEKNLLKGEMFQKQKICVHRVELNGEKCLSKKKKKKGKAEINTTRMTPIEGKRRKYDGWEVIVYMGVFESAKKRKIAYCTVIAMNNRDFNNRTECDRLTKSIWVFDWLPAHQKWVRHSSTMKHLNI